ncbi:MAG TPA: FG-GAP repeat protein, partial [Vicinamibacterales bacterium]|nr:FG-GAP repeat protein [Vicinamibacterales bacterium]
MTIDDRGARYPVVVDPLIEQARLTASDGSSVDHFGASVAVSGDTLVVGALFDDIGGNSNQGSAYVFTRTDGVWSFQAKLVASDGAAEDEFGLSVAVSGDTVIVGAHFDDVGIYGNQGSAYVFTRSGALWTQQAKLSENPRGLAGIEFGFSVAISGDTAIVGAPRNTLGGHLQGSAYILTRSGNVWSLEAQLTPSDAELGDFFGVSVAVSGDTVAVGAYLDDIGSNVNQGSAYVFTRSGAIWTEQAKLTASDGVGPNANGVTDYFGYSIAVSGDTVVVGAYLADVGVTADQGAAYVFIRSGANWSQQAKLTASDGAAGDGFGFNLSVSGDRVLVCAPSHDVSQGAAYLFTRNGADWLQSARITDS